MAPAKKAPKARVVVPAAVANEAAAVTPVSVKTLPEDDDKALEGFMVEINKTYGAGTLITIASQPAVRRIPTGIFDLDIALGGGIPIGRITLVWGAKAAGKSTLCGYIAANAQKTNRYDGLPLGDTAGCSPMVLEPVYRNKKGDAVERSEAVEIKKVVTKDMGTVNRASLKENYTVDLCQRPMRVLVVNQEGVLDPRWTKRLGVNNVYAMALNTETGEQTIDITDNMMRKRQVDLVIVDSLAAMTPMVETEASTEDNQRAAQAKLINKAVRVWVATLNSFKDSFVRPTMVLVNQERVDINVKHGDPNMKPGGKGQDFANSVDMKLMRGQIMKETDLSGEDDGSNLLLSRTKYKILRNKTFPPGSVGQYLVAVAPHKGLQPGQVIQHRRILEVAQQYGVIKSMAKDGKGGPYQLGKLSFRTLKEIGEWSVNEPVAFNRFSRQLIELIVRIRSGEDETAVLEPAQPAPADDTGEAASEGAG